MPQIPCRHAQILSDTAQPLPGPQEALQALQRGGGLLQHWPDPITLMPSLSPFNCSHAVLGDRIGSSSGGSHWLPISLRGKPFTQRNPQKLKIHLLVSPEQELFVFAHIVSQHKSCTAEKLATPQTSPRHAKAPACSLFPKSHGTTHQLLHAVCVFLAHGKY